MNNWIEQIRRADLKSNNICDYILGLSYARDLILF